MPFDIVGKTALVTGAGSGICHAFAYQLLEHGCNVVLADLSLKAEAEGTLKQFSTGPTRAVFIQTDVTDWKQLQAAFDKALSEFGTLDIVAPGAGVFEPPFSSFYHFPSSTDTEQTSSYKTLDINLTHPIRCTQLAIDTFMQQDIKHGVVLHVSSMSAQMAVAPAPLYSTSKAALSHFVRSMGALEQAVGVRVVAVAPGTVNPTLWGDADRGEYVKEERGDHWISPAEVASVMVEMVTNESYEGGTILEIGKEHTRRVEMLNDPGPDWHKKGMSTANAQGAVGQMMGLIGRNFGN